MEINNCFQTNRQVLKNIDLYNLFSGNFTQKLLEKKNYFALCVLFCCA